MGALAGPRRPGLSDDDGNLEGICNSERQRRGEGEEETPYRTVQVVLL
uniref:Uncharacterized protein n=1 Tax=Arundo donax TaxID=35708 RepID=A0A0A8Y589_ARUDO